MSAYVVLHFMAAFYMVVVDVVRLNAGMSQTVVLAFCFLIFWYLFFVANYVASDY